jgi:hypothetical protein
MNERSTSTSDDTSTRPLAPVALSGMEPPPTDVSPGSSDLGEICKSEED